MSKVNKAQYEALIEEQERARRLGRDISGDPEYIEKVDRLVVKITTTTGYSYLVSGLIAVELEKLAKFDDVTT